MVVLVELTIGMGADTISNAWALESVSMKTLNKQWLLSYVVAVYALPVLTVLAVGAGILTSQDGNGVNLFRIGLVVVHKVATVALGTWPAQKVVVAELVRVLALLDSVHDGDIDNDGLVEAAHAGVPVGLLGRDLLVLGAGAAGIRGRGGALGARAGLVGRQRDAHGRRGRAVGDSIGVGYRRRVGAARRDAAGRAGGAANGGGIG